MQSVLLATLSRLSLDHLSFPKPFLPSVSADNGEDASPRGSFECLPLSLVFCVVSLVGKETPRQLFITASFLASFRLIK